MRLKIYYLKNYLILGKVPMKTIINTAIIASILLTLLFIMRRETAALNSKILELNGGEGNAIEMVERDVSSANQFIE